MNIFVDRKDLFIIIIIFGKKESLEKTAALLILVANGMSINPVEIDCTSWPALHALPTYVDERVLAQRESTFIFELNDLRPHRDLERILFWLRRDTLGHLICVHPSYY